MYINPPRGAPRDNMGSVGNEGSTMAQRSLPLSTSYIPDGNPGPYGGGTYTNYPTEPTLRDYENIFGPSARDIKDDLQKYKRHGRWHLPDILKGPNPWLTDRIDGLITDATNSPFTSIILPYRYYDNVDGKIKWNVWSFDEAMASRVPYEAAARTLTQSKRSFAGYAVRHGLAINLEHNFMMTPQGRENFQNQLRQLIGSIQYSNDLDVHMALILAPSYEKTQSEKFFGEGKTSAQVCREFVDLFGFMQKNQNALDILIEESKIRLKTWGGPMPDFMLCNSKLGFQLQMVPERTNYLTQGPDGVKRLKQGPELSSYRGLKIIHTRAFSLETGLAPRDMLRRRVRVAEYYRIPPSEHNWKREFEFYNEARDNWFTLTFLDLLNMARVDDLARDSGAPLPGDGNGREIGDISDLWSELLSAPRPGGATGSRLPPAPRRGVLGRAVGRYQHPVKNAWSSNRTGMQKGKRTINAVGRPRARFLAGPAEDAARMYREQLNSATWEKYLFASLPDVNVVAQLRCGLNREIVAFELSPSSFMVFVPNFRVGNFKIAVKCPPLETALNQKEADSGKSCQWVLNQCFPYPSTNFWTRVHAAFDWTKAGLSPGRMFEVKRNLMRYGIPLALEDEAISENFILKPLGAFDEPNNAYHAKKVDGDGGVWAGTLHVQLLLTSEALDALFQPRDKHKGFGQYLKSNLSNVMDKLYQIYTQLISNLTGDTSILEFSVAFSKAVTQEFGHDKSKSYCREKLIWTFPDIPQYEFLSFMNLCTGNGFGFEVLRQLMQAVGDKKKDSLLTEDFLTACNAFYLEASDDLKQNLKQVDRRFFGRVYAPRIIPPGGNTKFKEIMQQRLFGDAFARHIKEPPSDYYANSEVENFVAVFKTFGRRFAEEFNPRNALHIDQETPSPGGLASRPIGQDVLLDMAHEAVGAVNYDDSDSERSVDPEHAIPDDDEHDAHDGPALLPLPGPQPAPDADPDDQYDDSQEAESGSSEEPGPSGPSGGGGYPSGGYDPSSLPPTVERQIMNMTKDVEIVVLRPNIEHYMLGIIMGLAGENLGNTLWGQTELSVYDDSMHGVWGMSYK